ncbi:hypothetical protein [Prescottella equi]|nr:hypothetical protein [Prescottella equi]
MNHHTDGSLATLLEHVPPSNRARALIDYYSAIADQFVNSHSEVPA